MIFLPSHLLYRPVVFSVVFTKNTAEIMMIIIFPRSLAAFLLATTTPIYTSTCRIYYTANDNRKNIC